MLVDQALGKQSTARAPTSAHAAAGSEVNNHQVEGEDEYYDEEGYEEGEAELEEESVGLPRA